MNSSIRVRSRTMFAVHPTRRERGVVLFIVLLIMVVLSMAGVALMRSVDTSTSVAGNLALRQGTVPVVNMAVENALSSLAAINKDADQTGNNYYATMQAGASANGIPALLQGPKSTMAAAYAAAGLSTIDPDTNITAGVALSGNEVRYVIERVCNANGIPAINTCDMSPPKMPSATTAMELDKIMLGRVPFYRLTVRVDGPANTVSFAQAMLR
jgi:Tfp pilus assembly protein PilX